MNGPNAQIPPPRQIPPAVTAQVLRHIARRVGPPPPPAGGNEPPPEDVGLLTRAVEVGLLDKAPDAPQTPEQSNFINQANQAIPDAAQRIQENVREAK